MALTCKTIKSNTVVFPFTLVTKTNYQTAIKIIEKEMPKGAVVCSICGFGNKNEWHPLLESSQCPTCGSNKRR